MNDAASVQARAMVLRGMFCTSGAVCVVFGVNASDNFSGRWGELTPEARAGWESVVRVMAPFIKWAPVDPATCGGWRVVEPEGKAE